MLIINDQDTCPECGAYYQGNGYCVNGHLRKAARKEEGVGDSENVDNSARRVKCDWCKHIIEPPRQPYAVQMDTVPKTTDYICKACMRTLAMEAGEHVDDVYDSETHSYWPIYRWYGLLWGFPDPHYDGAKTMLILSGGAI